MPRRLSVAVAVALIATPLAAASPAAADQATPNVRWVAPADGAVLQGDVQELVIHAAFSQSDDAGVERVEVTADGQPLSSIVDNDEWDPKGGMYRTAWKTAGLTGTYVLVATAMGTNGTATSATSTVTLRQPVCPEDLRQCPAPRLSLSAPIITTGQSAAATVRGAEGAAVELLAYSRPSTTFRVIRTGRISGGLARFNVVPTTNTRLFARYRGTAVASTSVSLPVRLKISGYVTEDPYEGLDFVGGGIRPARAKTVQIYRVLADGRRVAMLRTNSFVPDGQAYFGEYYGFTKAGRYTFVATTAADSLNAASESPRFTYTVRYPVGAEYAGVINLGA